MPSNRSVGNQKMNAMHSVKKYLVWMMVWVLSGAIIGCEKDASEEAFGKSVVYLPQAAYANLRYEVPMGKDSATKNYFVDASGEKVNIILGVLRSGMETPAAYSVEVKPLEDTVSKLITNGVFPSATHLVMPSTLYQLPSSVSVPAGSYGTAFYVSLNKAALKSYAGKKLLLAVGISNPSMYQLSPGLNKVIVIIDVNALNL